MNQPNPLAVLATDETATHFVLLRPGLSTMVKKASFFKRQRNAEALAAEPSNWHLQWIPVKAASIADAATYQPNPVTESAEHPQAPQRPELPDYMMRYSPERDEEGHVTGNLTPSDYGMWVASVSVHRLHKELRAEIAALEAQTKAALAEAHEHIASLISHGEDHNRAIDYNDAIQRAQDYLAFSEGSK